MSRILPVALAVLAVTVVLGAYEPNPDYAQRPASALDSLPSGAEFPPYDAQLWSFLQRGYTRKLAARRLEQGSYTPDTVELLLKARRVEDALLVTRRIVERHPALIPATFEGISREHSKIHDDRSRDYAARLHGLIDEARKRLPSLPREEAARAERQLLWVDARRAGNGDTVDARLRRLVQDYPSTETALLTQVELIQRDVPLPKRLDELDAFARRHPGTVAAAKALIQKGWGLAHGMPADPKTRKGEDPTARFMQVLAVAKELESGRYPRSEWVDQAPSIVTRFSAYEPLYAPDNVPVMEAAIIEFARTHFVLDEENPLNSGVASMLTRTLARLWTDKRTEIDGVERALLSLEGGVPDADAARYLRALYYIRTAHQERNVDQAGLLRKARDVLADIASRGNGLFARKALATLGSQYFSERNDVAASDQFRKYIVSYPEADWAWVAALRIGQCHEGAGDWKAAEAAYRGAAAQYRSNPVARVLGHAYSGRAREALSEFNEALAEHQLALSAWDDDFVEEYSQTYSLFEMYRPPNGPVSDARPSEVAKFRLEDRIAQLKTSLAAPGGALLERGRWLLEKGHRKEALVPLQQVLAQHPRSPVVSDARYLTHRARLGFALDSAPALAAPEYDALAAEPLDFAVLAAKMARAYVMWKRGPAEGEAALQAALDDWASFRKPSTSGASRATLERDVAEIRAHAFQSQSSMGAAQLGDGPSVGLLVVDPEVQVKLADGQLIRVQTRAGFSDGRPVLFLSAEEMRFLEEMMAKIAGPPVYDYARGKERTPVLWDKFFRRSTGHRPGWQVVSYPVTSVIEFLDTHRTKAAARVVANLQGWTVVLEKVGNAWTVKDRVNHWIS